MKCYKCGNELRIVPEQVGVDERSVPVYHRIGYCDNCMIKTDIDLLSDNTINVRENQYSNPYISSDTNKNKRQSISSLIIGIIIFLIIVFNFDVCSNDTQENDIDYQRKEQIAVYEKNEIEENNEKDSEITINSNDSTENTEKTIELPIGTDISKEEYISLCQEYNYKNVLRNPSEYVGQKVKITIEISSVHEETWLNNRKYYFGYSENEYGFYGGDRYAVFDCRQGEDLKLLSDDIIIVYGEITEPEYTKSYILNSEELFCINMYYVDLIGE